MTTMYNDIVAALLASPQLAPGVRGVLGLQVGSGSAPGSTPLAHRSDSPNISSDTSIISKMEAAIEMLEQTETMSSAAIEFMIFLSFRKAEQSRSNLQEVRFSNLLTPELLRLGREKEAKVGELVLGNQEATDIATGVLGWPTLSPTGTMQGYSVLFRGRNDASGGYEASCLVHVCHSSFRATAQSTAEGGYRALRKAISDPQLMEECGELDLLPIFFQESENERTTMRAKEVIHTVIGDLIRMYGWVCSAAPLLDTFVKGLDESAAGYSVKKHQAAPTTFTITVSQDQIRAGQRIVLSILRQSVERQKSHAAGSVWSSFLVRWTQAQSSVVTFGSTTDTAIPVFDEPVLCHTPADAKDGRLPDLTRTWDVSRTPTVGKLTLADRLHNITLDAAETPNSGSTQSKTLQRPAPNRNPARVTSHPKGKRIANVNKSLEPARTESTETDGDDVTMAAVDQSQAEAAKTLAKKMPVPQTNREREGQRKDPPLQRRGIAGQQAAITTSGAKAASQAMNFAPEGDLPDSSTRHSAGDHDQHEAEHNYRGSDSPTTTDRTRLSKRHQPNNESNTADAAPSGAAHPVSTRSNRAEQQDSRGPGFRLVIPQAPVQARSKRMIGAPVRAQATSGNQRAQPIPRTERTGSSSQILQAPAPLVRRGKRKQGVGSDGEEAQDSSNGTPKSGAAGSVNFSSDEDGPREAALKRRKAPSAAPEMGADRNDPSSPQTEKDQSHDDEMQVDVGVGAGGDAGAPRGPRSSGNRNYSTASPTPETYRTGSAQAQKQDTTRSVPHGALPAKCRVEPVGAPASQALVVSAPNITGTSGTSSFSLPTMTPVVGPIVISVQDSNRCITFMFDAMKRRAKACVEANPRRALTQETKRSLEAIKARRTVTISSKWFFENRRIFAEGDTLIKLSSVLCQGSFNSMVSKQNRRYATHGGVGANFGAYFCEILEYLDREVPSSIASRALNDVPPRLTENYAPHIMGMYLAEVAEIERRLEQKRRAYPHLAKMVADILLLPLSLMVLGRASEKTFADMGTSFATRARFTKKEGGSSDFNTWKQRVVRAGVLWSLAGFQGLIGVAVSNGFHINDGSLALSAFALLDSEAASVSFASELQVEVLAVPPHSLSDSESADDTPTPNLSINRKHIRQALDRSMRSSGPWRRCDALVARVVMPFIDEAEGVQDRPEVLRKTLSNKLAQAQANMTTEDLVISYYADCLELLAKTNVSEVELAAGAKIKDADTRWSSIAERAADKLANLLSPLTECEGPRVLEDDVERAMAARVEDYILKVNAPQM